MAAHSGPSTSSPSGAALGAAAGASGSEADAGAAPASAAPKAQANADLIALDDLAEALTTTAVVGPQQGAPAPSGPSAGACTGSGVLSRVAVSSSRQLPLMHPQ